MEELLSQQEATDLTLLAWRRFGSRNDELWRETWAWHGEIFAVWQSLAANRTALRRRGGSG